jgi:hypothetical protein
VVEELENRRVELFFFPAGISPAPRSANSGATATEYAQWREAIVEERTFRPSEAGLGRVFVVTDYDPVYAAIRSLVLDLQSVDGAYACTLEASRAEVHASGTLAFEFAGVPMGSALTLVGRTADGEIHELFTDVPYLQISTLAPGGAPTSPFVVDDAAPRSWWHEWLAEEEDAEWSDE